MITDLVKHADVQKLYRQLSPEDRLRVHERMMDIGHDDSSCEWYGINYYNVDMGKLTAAAIYELELFQ